MSWNVSESKKGFGFSFFLNLENNIEKTARLGKPEEMSVKLANIMIKGCVGGLLLFVTGCAVIPIPLTEEEIRQRVKGDLEQLAEYQEPVSRPITLYEAMARALKFNLETRVEVLKEMVEHRQLDLAHYDLLPKVVADAAYNGRSNYSGSSSRSLTTGRQSLESSTSAEKNIFTANLTLSWDMLDFGLSYVRAEQAANDVLVAEEDKRRVANRVIQDVRAAFWKAVSAERVLGRLGFLEGWVSKALQEVEMIKEKRLEAPLILLQYERDLLGAQREIQQLYQELSFARVHLAELMNLDPGEPYELVVSDSQQVDLPLPGQLDELEQRALVNRPELRKVDYQKRINAKETKAAILELLPNINMFVGGHYDSNSFLFHNNWLTYGAKVSWNLLNVFRHPARKQVIEAQDQVLDAQSLALTMAIMTQVHVATAQYQAALQDVRMAARYAETQEKITEHLNQVWSVKGVNEHQVIREKVQSLVAKLRHESAKAKVEMAYANLLAAIGEDPFPQDISSDNLDELTQALEERWTWLQREEVFTHLTQFTPTAEGSLR